MGNALSLTPEQAAQRKGLLAASLDKDIEEPEDARERVFSAVSNRWKETENTERRLGMARSVPWHYFQAAGDAFDAASFLKLLLRAPADEDSVHNAQLLSGPPQSSQFADRHLPGNVRQHPYDNHPTNAMLWDFDTAEHSTRMRPTVELARAHPGDLSQDDCTHGVAGSIQESYPKGEYAPLTTKAGSRLWAVGFVAPPKPDQGEAEATAQVLRAAYQMQLLVRIDKGRQAIVYDAFDHLPTTETAWKAMQESEQDLVTPSELKKIERTLKATGSQSGIVSAMLQANFGGENDEDDGEEERPAVLPRDRPHAERVAHHHPAMLLPLLNMLRFKQSHCFRARVPMSLACGARLLIVGFDRPHADLPALSSGLHVPISSLGRGPPGDGQVESSDSGSELEDEDEDEDDGDDDGDGEQRQRQRSRYSDRARPGSFEHCGAEIEPLGILVLEFPTRGANASFAATKLYPSSRAARKRVPCADWTPGAICSDATRHYIVGDKSEIVELAKSLAESSEHLAALLRSDLSDTRSDTVDTIAKRSRKKQKKHAAAAAAAAAAASAAARRPTPRACALSPHLKAPPCPPTPRRCRCAPGPPSRPSQTRRPTRTPGLTAGSSRSLRPRRAPPPSSPSGPQPMGGMLRLREPRRAGS